jgi:hypothetical protein
MVGSQFELPPSTPFGPVSRDAPTASWDSPKHSLARDLSNGPCVILSCEFLQSTAEFTHGVTRVANNDSRPGRVGRHLLVVWAGQGRR